MPLLTNLVIEDGNLVGIQEDGSKTPPLKTKPSIGLIEFAHHGRERAEILEAARTSLRTAFASQYTVLDENPFFARHGPDPVYFVKYMEYPPVNKGE